MELSLESEEIDIRQSPEDLIQNLLLQEARNEFYRDYKGRYLGKAGRNNQRSQVDTFFHTYFVTAHASGMSWHESICVLL